MKTEWEIQGSTTIDGKTFNVTWCPNCHMCMFLKEKAEHQKKCKRWKL